MALNINRIQALQKADEVHKQNLKKIVEHRLEVARLKGDEQLIHQLEAEQAYYQ